MILSIKIPQKGAENYFKFSQEFQKDKSLLALSPDIHHIGSWARHFKSYAV